MTAALTVPACGGESLTHQGTAGSGGTSAEAGSGGDVGGSTGHVGGAGGKTSGGSGVASVTTGGTGSGTAGSGPGRGGTSGESSAGNESGGTRPGNGGSATSTGGTSIGGANASGGTKGGAGANDGGATNGGTSPSGGIGGNAGTSGRGGTSGSAGTSGHTSSGGSGGTSGGAGTSASGGTSSATGCVPTDNRIIIPNSTGWVDHQDECNDVGVQGSWHPYGDQYGNGSGDKACLTKGQHQPSECAQITAPDPTLPAFPNVNGVMTTTGTIEKVLPCVAGSPAATIPTSGCPGDGLAGGYDYGNMWGAGIAFDFNADKGPPDGDGLRMTWDPDAYGVVGIRFTIINPPPSLRVEFPMELTAVEAAEDTPPITTTPATTDAHSAGAPYWGATPDGKYPNSPVVEGVNTITWDTVGVPRPGIYTFDRSRILGIKFHIQATTAASVSYDFAIRDLTFLRHL